MYAVHPGLIRSVSDGDMHFISAGQLARLYGLRPYEYVVWKNNTGMVWEELIHLFPQVHKEQYDQERDKIASARET